MSMGTYIKELRTQKKMSQEELGKVVGVNRAAVNKWESGQVENIKRSVIIKLANFFNVSPVELMQFEDSSMEHIKHTNRLTEEEEELIESYRSLPKESRMLVSAFLKMHSDMVFKNSHNKGTSSHREISDKPEEPRGCRIRFWS